MFTDKIYKAKKVRCSLKTGNTTSRLRPIREKVHARTRGRKVNIGLHLEMCLGVLYQGNRRLPKRDKPPFKNAKKYFATIATQKNMLSLMTKFTVNKRE